jgi:hypothetical protein
MFLPFALLITAQVSGASAPADRGSDAPLIAACNARVAEIPVTVTAKGIPKQTKVKICGKVGQTDGEWATTLRDALAKVEGNLTLSPSVKGQIVSGLKLELAKVASAAPAATANSLPLLNPSAPSIVPSLAPPPVPAPAAEIGRVEYSALPPMPAPLPAVAAAATVAAAPPPLPAPKMTFRCLSTNSLGSESTCDLLERDTLLTVLADEDLPSGTSLRFLRRGDTRAEVDLPPLRRGQSQRFPLPAKVCQGVAGSRVEIEVVRAAKPSSQVVDTRGPYELRC